MGSPAGKGVTTGKGSLSSEIPGSASQVKPPESEGGEEAKVGVVRREARRRLMVEGIEAFAPKRRSSRVSCVVAPVHFNMYIFCG